MTTETIFPWRDVQRARKNSSLQAKHPAEDGKDRYLPMAKPCPSCGVEPDALTWIYFSSPGWTWRNLCGTAGWMTICENCHAQVEFFLEVMS
jgi:hypothetical protein